MEKIKFTPGDLVLVNYPRYGFWPCRVTRVLSKKWRKVEYFGGREIGKAHLKVIREYDDVAKNDLKKYIPKKKQKKYPMLKLAVEQINKIFVGDRKEQMGASVKKNINSKKGANNNKVLRLTSSESTVATNNNCGLRVWDVREGSCLRILPGHTGVVLHVQFDGRLVVSGSSVDRTIKIWDPETGECLRSMDHVSYIKSLKFNGDDVVASYADGSIKVWDVDTGVCRHTLVRDGSWVMKLQGNILVCRGADRTTAKIWSNSTGACLHTLAGQKKHSGIITGIQFNHKFVVTSSGDGTVKLWDIKTGEFIRDLLVLESGEKMMSMRMKYPKIVCTVSLNRGIKLIVLNFDTNNEDYKVNQG